MYSHYLSVSWIMCGYFEEEVTCQSTLEVTGLMGNDTYKSPVYSRIFKNEMLRSPWLGPLKATIF